MRTRSQNDQKLTSNILFGCSVRDSIGAEFCPFLSSTNLSIGRRSSCQSDRQIHRHVSPNLFNELLIIDHEDLERDAEE